MPAESNTFLMLDLKDSRTKKIAQAIQNDTCKKILDLLSHGHKTETEISKELGIAISTVHYNLTLLVESKLAKADEYHYSKKGKEVLHYSLANKFVIIAPGDANPSLLEKLKTIIPVALIVVGAAYMFNLFSKIIGSQASSMSERAVYDTSNEIAQKAMPLAVEEVADAGFAMQATAIDTLNQSAPQVIENVIYVNNNANLMLYFILGAAFCLVVYLIVDYIRNKRR